MHVEISRASRSLSKAAASPQAVSLTVITICTWTMDNCVVHSQTGKHYSNQLKTQEGTCYVYVYKSATVLEY